MSIQYHSIIKKVTAADVDTNYLTLIEGTGKEFITNLMLCAEVNSSAMAAFSPPPAEGLQLDADRQAQLRNYAESADQFKLNIYLEQNQTAPIQRKTVRIFKLYPDHQIDLFPLLWATQEAGIGHSKWLMSFDSQSLLPTANDKVVIYLDYYVISDNSESWFTVQLSANTESSLQLPDNCYFYQFKQINGQQPLKWANNPGIIAETTTYDVLSPEVEEQRDNTNNDTHIYFAGDADTTVLIKAWS